MLFITRNGIVDHYDGYVFEPDGVLEDDPLGGGAIEVETLGGDWFFIRAV